MKRFALLILVIIKLVSLYTSKQRMYTKFTMGRVGK